MNLDLEQLNRLSPAEREHYMKLEKLFAQPGWKVVMKAAQENVAAAFRQAAFAANWDQNRAAIGNMSAWQAIVDFESSTHARFLEKIAEANSDRELARLNEEHDFE